MIQRYRKGASEAWASYFRSLSVLLQKSGRLVSEAWESCFGSLSVLLRKLERLVSEAERVGFQAVGNKKAAIARRG